MKSGQPVEISKVLFIVAVCAITCVLAMGITYITPEGQSNSPKNSVLENPALEELIYNQNVPGPTAYKGMRGKIKPVAPWQQGN